MLILILTILFISYRLNKESILAIEANASLNKLTDNLERIVEERTADLKVVNNELAFQNEEKEKRAAELIIANKELLAFTYISSHDLQEPLRKIQTFASIILENENKNLSENGKYNFQRMQLAARRMQQLIDDLLAFSRIKTTDHKFEKTDLRIIIEDVKTAHLQTHTCQRPYPSIAKYLVFFTAPMVIWKTFKIYSLCRLWLITYKRLIRSSLIRTCANKDWLI